MKKYNKDDILEIVADEFAKIVKMLKDPSLLIVGKLLIDNIRKR